MLPPGNISGRTTKESVVKAKRDPFTVTMAPSWRCSSMGLPKAGMKIFSMSWWVRRPPPPCASTMRSSATRGTGQLRLNVLTSAIVIVGCARALRRYHGRAQRILGRALHCKGWTFVRLFDSLQNQSADALRRFAGRLTLEGEAEVGIVFSKTSAKLKSASRDFSEAAPLPGSYFENLCNAFLRRAIPFPPHGSRVLILDVVAPFFELADRHVDAFEQVEGLESGDNDRDFIFLRDRKVLFESHDRADVAGGEKSLDDAIGG